jgi:ferric-dicitrate binding protein FerR (iron transport regulator)
LQLRRTFWIARGSGRAALRLPLLVVAATLAAGSGTARAQQLPESGRVLILNGRVSAEHAGGDLWALLPDQTVNPGQVVVTGADGYAQLELSDHSVIEVFPNSRMVFRPNRSNWKDLVDIYLGKIRLQIQHLTDGGSPYHVTSPTAVISIRGTVLDVEVGPANDTTVQVETGVIGVRHRLLPGKEVAVETGQSLRVLPNVPLAAVKLVSPFVVAGRVARIAVDTLARMGTQNGPSGKSGGSSGGAPKPTSGGSAGDAGTSAGTNQPTPVGGQDGNGNSGSNNNGSPPGDVIRP